MVSSNRILKNNRIEALDIAKGIGILIVVMGHCGFGSVFDKLIHVFHMPLFFFISGYFYRPEKTKKFGKYLTHQINVLMVPYIFFAIFYSILHYLYVGDFSFQYFFKSLLSSNHYRIDVAGALWFLMALFSAKILYCLLERNIKDIIHLTIVISIISFIAFTLRKFGIMLPLGMDSALSMLIVIHAGYVLYRYRNKKLLTNLSSLSPIVIIIVAILFFLTGLFNDPVSVRRNKYGTEVLYMISCFCGIILTMNASYYLSKRTNKFLMSIRKMFSFWGRESIVFLLVNELFLFVVSELFVVIGFSREFLIDNYWLRGLFVLGAMGLMSIAALFSHHKPLSYIFGKASLFRQDKN